MIIFGGALIVDKEDMVLDAATTVELENGEVLERIYTDNRTLVTIEEIPDHVEKAFIAIEDSRFYEHGGVDPQAVARAVYKDIIAMAKVEGGSTLTMQLSKNLFLTNDKTWMRKTKEVMAALYLERELTKKEILELYLNRIYFGHGIYGIEQAAQEFFNKPASELTVSEGAVLAAMPKAPNSFSPIDEPEAVKKRRNLVLKRMNDLGMIDTETMMQMQGKTLQVAEQEEEAQNWSNSYVDLVIKEAAKRYQISREELKRGGYRIIVKMDPEIQKVAYRQIENGEFVPGSKPGVQAAFTLMDNETGAVVAAVGGKGFRHGGLNRVVVKRQPASTIKPLAVYGPAMMKEEYHPYSLLVDKKMKFGDYAPRNYDDQYAGITSIYNALVESKNVPAVSLLDQIGIDYAKGYLEKMDLKTKTSGLGLALGGLNKGYSPLQLTEAYSTFANGGKKVESFTIKKIIDRSGKTIHKHETKVDKVFSAQVAWNMTEMLQRVVSHGTGQAGSYPKALAGKTGTHEHGSVKGKIQDVWFAGYTPGYSGSLWMGYDSSDKTHYLEGGSSYPTKLMKQILTEVNTQKDLAAHFKKPEKVEDLAPPVTLPVITDLDVKLDFGGATFVQGRLTWTPAADNRVQYRIYEEVPGVDKRVGEVTGKGEYKVSVTDIFGSNTYYVVPYNPLTKLEGKSSNPAVLEWD